MRYYKALLGGVATAALSSSAGAGAVWAAPAAATANSSGIAEVVVTARKRSESLQRVPVAITAVSGKALQQQGLFQVSDLQKTVPSLTITTGTSPAGGTGALFDLRGQAASDTLLTISQAVGLYEDGVNIPHPIGANLAFFDIGRVEVLKGPQGTLYGRNTTGGAVNIFTRQPDFNGYHGFLYAEAGNFNDGKFGGAVNLPLIPDVLAVRLAAQHWSREGYGESAVTGERLGGDKNDTTLRLGVDFEPRSNLTAKFQLEYDEADHNGELWKGIYNNGTPNLEAGLESGGVLVNAPAGAFCDGLPFTCASVNSVGALGAAALSRVTSNKNIFQNDQEEYSFERVQVWHAGATLAWDLTSNIQLKSISGFHWFDQFQNYDLDGSPFQLLEINGQPLSGTLNPLSFRPESIDGNFSQELNLSGKEFENRLNWLVGAYYNTDRGQGTQPYTASTLLLKDINGGLDAAFGTPGAVYSAGGGAHDARAITNQSWAIFTQDDFRITDKFSVTAGYRYTEERLGLVLDDYQYDAGSGQFSCTTSTVGWEALPNPAACTTAQNAKFTGSSYLGSLNYQATDNILIYAKTARGFRGGALQARAPGFPAASPETATDYELGFKADFFSHHLRTDLDVYQTNYANKQESTILANDVGNTFTVIENSGSARIRGFEGEVTANPLQGLSLYGTLTYLDGVYLSFPNALTPNGVQVNASGFAFLEPRWRYSLGARYEIPAGPGRFAIQGDWDWRGQIPTNALNNDTTAPLSLQQSLRTSVGLLNARLEYNMPDKGLSLALFATNLLDKHYLEDDLAGAAIGGITLATVEAPRMWGVSVRKTFGPSE